MNLDEAIEHASEKAKDKNVCEECRKDHEQLAGWLEELRERRNAKVDSSAIVDALCQCDLFLANVTKHAHPKPVPGDECVACVGARQLRAQVSPVLTQALIAARMNRADTSKMRWALEFVRGELLGVINGGSTSSLKCLTVIENALVDSPARNCDVGSDWLNDFYCKFHPPKGMREMPPEWVDAVTAFCKWLVAPAKGETK